jgi:hypothetical protein
MTGFQKLSIQKAKILIPHSVLSCAASCQSWLAMEMVRVGHWAEGLKGWAVPILDEPEQTAGESGEVSAREERIAPAGIVILGLAEIIFVAFLTGYQSGALHPVWQGIVGLAGVGLVWMMVRLVRIIKGRASR